MKKKWNDSVCLDGQWQLFIQDNSKHSALSYEPTTVKELKKLNYTSLPASVPGNFELDMEKAGMLPELMKGLNILEVQKLEAKHLWYCRRFNNTFTDKKRCFLNFEGIDTFAEIYLNGELIGETDNMLIPHEIPVPEILDGENELVVHIRPSVIEARKYPIEASSMVHGKNNASALMVRKAPHMYGWDIMPRVVSGGLWRSVELICKPKEYISDLYLFTGALREKRAVIILNYNICVCADDIKEYSLEIEGICGDSKFYQKALLWQTSGRLAIYVEMPKLWWPKDMGEQSLYNVTVKLLHNDSIIETEKTKLGIREVSLKRTSTIDKDGNGEFQFYINREKLFVRGTNWVPLDAFHSRDRERYPKALALLDKSGCNMVRCWGGNVYEEDEFFDFCDEHGIGVWQDFAMACAVYPRTQRMLDLFQKEAESVVANLRHHPSIFLWAGDNECDRFYQWSVVSTNPIHNRITREVFPEVIRRLDPMRIQTYLPSSPYVDDEAFKNGGDISEDHLWGERGYYKTPFYSECKAKFASEIGYFGCPAPDSLRRFMTDDGIWPWNNSKEWYIAAVNCELSDEAESKYVPKAICNQIEKLFGTAPTSLSDYTLASQITQAEAMKFFVEHFRINKWNKTGIMCWNLIDGWPQTSNGFADYYFKEKLVFETVRIAQLPVCLACDEPKDGYISLCGMNEYLENKNIEYRVTDLSDNSEVAKGKTVLPANASISVALIPYDGAKRCYRIEWYVDGKKLQNHYLAGTPTFDLESVSGYYEKLSLLNRKDFD